MDRKERQLIEAVRDQMAVSLSGGRRKRVIAAVSGGADSMCLLEILTLLAPQMGFGLLVAHVNHGIRGKEAEAAFLCKKRRRAGACEERASQ